MNDLVDRKSGLPPTERTKPRPYGLMYRIRTIIEKVRLLYVLL